MSEKNLTQDELEKMQKAVGEISEEELQEIVGAGGDVNAETTLACVNAATKVTSIITSTWTKRPFCK
jgi:type 2 lantibiotic (TIGR03893 family)